jgi:histidinol dehydrogenase
MKLYDNPQRIHWQKLAQRPYFKAEKLEKKVRKILQRVKIEGEDAVQDFNKAFDKAQYKDLKVSYAEMVEAENVLSKELKLAIRVAYQNIWKFHEAQTQKELVIETMPGVTCKRKSVPVESVGLYIPGGSAPLFSTLLMLAIPAKIAGCRNIVVCTPVDKFGNVHPAVLFVAGLLKLEYVFKIGGAQAIAAMAYGTETVPKCDKIFGPGNQFVTAAKMQVNKEGIAIDMPAGPSEVLVLADRTANAAFVAADLLSQAEHGEDSQAVLVTTTPYFADEVKQQVKEQLKKLLRKEIAKKCLKKSYAVFFDNMDEALDFVNFYAAEHLILAVDDADTLATQIKNAGSVFIGNYTPESAGDYASGTNHTLPTGGFARSYSGVSVDSFVKKITFQHITKEGLKNIGSTVETMAEAEGLQAHKNAVSIRLKEI